MEQEWNGFYVPSLATPLDLNEDGIMDVVFYQGSKPTPAVAGVTYVDVSATVGGKTNPQRLKNGTFGQLTWMNDVTRKWEDKNYYYPIPEADKIKVVIQQIFFNSNKFLQINNISIMKSRSLLLTALLLMTAFSIRAQSTFNVATFNIRYANQSDTGHLWVDRAPVVTNLIRFHNFDVFGIQEGLKNQIDDISSALPEYSRYGVGRDDGIDAGEHSVIYYKKDKFKLLKSGDFWLSETPDKPGKGWDATCCNRICSWVYLQNIQSKKKFYMFNVHFDHQGVVARKESSKLMLKKIKEIAGNEPVLFTGDFNGSRSSEWYQTIANSGIVKDTHDGVKHPYENNSSMNGFRTPRGMEVIDHIFISKQFTTKKWGILTDTYFGKYPSDHFPVIAEVSL